jgi:hypothetical protein
MKRAAIPLISLFAVIGLAVGISALVSASSDDDTYYHGNVDCAYPNFPPYHTREDDAMHFLQLVAGVRGVPIDCSLFLPTHTYCDPGPAPSTNCDTPDYYHPTTAPGDPIPKRLDFNCDGASNTLDLLALLRQWAFAEPTPTPCPDRAPTLDPA